MPNDVLIVGSRGRIGSVVVRRLSRRTDIKVTALAREDLPLDTPEFLREKLSSLSFDLLVNAAAITSVDACEQDGDAAWAVNAVAPGIMALVCREKGARMIHLSTDYVFDGVKPGLRSEEDYPQPLGKYGRSKLGGEAGVLRAAPNNLVLRTSWVFGSQRASFPDMILARALEGAPVEAIDDKWSSPCYSEDFAAWLEVLLWRPEIGGVLHMCNSGECTWREYAQAVLDIAVELGLNIPLRTANPMPMSSMARFTAPRPVHSAMSCQRLTRLTGIQPRPWRDALRDYLADKVSTKPPHP